MNDLKKLLMDTINFLKRRKLVSVIIAIGLFILFLIFLTTAFSPQNNKQTDQITPTSSATAVNPPATQSLNLSEPAITWSPKTFVENKLQHINFQKTQLPGDSIKYTYPSTNRNRPNEIIVKNGTVVYQRTVISNKYIYNYTGPLDAPDYVFQGSRFFGPNTMVYVYTKTGTAFVADADTTIVREQINFQPMNIEDFKNKYGEDIIDFTIIPTQHPE